MIWVFLLTSTLKDGKLEMPPESVSRDSKLPQPNPGDNNTKPEKLLKSTLINSKLEKLTKSASRDSKLEKKALIDSKVQTPLWHKQSLVIGTPN